jgi:hypothetical protein
MILILLLMSSLLIGEIVFFSYSYTTYSNLQDIYAKSKHEEIVNFTTPSLFPGERKIAHAFNDLYFEATSSCSCKYLSRFFVTNLHVIILS